jgi:type II secretory pathway pseudopilin PulG
MRPSLHPSRRQRGFTLMMTLVFLVIFLLFAISMASSSMINTKVASNQQYRMEARSVAQQGVEAVMNQAFTLNPIPASSVPIDVTGDGNNDFTAQVAAPFCLDSKPVLNRDLSLGDVCRTPTSSSGDLLVGSSGSAAAFSLCSDTQWEIQSSVTDPNNSATSVTVHQGASVRVPVGTPCP